MFLFALPRTACPGRFGITMDEQLREAPSAETWTSDLARSLQAHRDRARQAVSAQRGRLVDLRRKLESELTEFTRSAGAEKQSLENERAAIAQLQQSLQQQRDEIARQSSQTSTRENELAVRLAQLDEQQQQLDRRASELDAKSFEVVDQAAKLGTSHDSLVARQEELFGTLASRLAQLDDRASSIAQTQQHSYEQLEQLARREAAVDALDAEVRVRQANLEEASAALEQDRQQLEADLESLRELTQSSEQSLSQREAQLQDLTRRLEDRERDLKIREQHTNRQRHSIAQQLRSRKKEALAEIELARLREQSPAQGAVDGELQSRLTQLQDRFDLLRQKLDESQTARDDLRDQLAEVNLLREQLKDRQSQLDQRAVELGQARTREDLLREERSNLTHERDDLAKQLAEARSERLKLEAEHAKAIAEQHRLEAELEDRESQLLRQQGSFDKQEASSRMLEVDTAHLEEQLAQLAEENRELREQLQDALAQSQGGSGNGAVADASALDDLRRRLEMATSDLRDLRKKNEDLQQQLAKAAKNGGNVPKAAASTGMDWEAQKRRLLEQLENDLDDDDPQQKAEKLTVKHAIETTDRILAEKNTIIEDRDREIEELRRLLENQSDNIGNVAVGAAAIAGMFDADELIRQERDNLQQLQESVREQHMRMELEISLERAKLARERAELEEKLQSFESDNRGRAANSASDAAADKNKKQPRGRWLTRLGLGDSDDK